MELDKLEAEANEDRAGPTTTAPPTVGTAEVSGTKPDACEINDESPGWAPEGS